MVFSLCGIAVFLSVMGLGLGWLGWWELVGGVGWLVGWFGCLVVS